MMVDSFSSFSSLVETLEPGVLGPLLNDYLTGMTDIVFAHEGTVAKIVGDAMHILFGAPSEQPGHATRAVSCALALDECPVVPRPLESKRRNAGRHATIRRARRSGTRSSTGCSATSRRTGAAGRSRIALPWSS